MIYKGQKKLAKTSMLLVGGGGLCSSAALYLAGAGVGKYHLNIYGNDYWS
jgi:molybdopterin/thiamine biosynthesis adenylyltransferase